MVNISEPQEEHLKYLREALHQAQKCQPIHNAFCVGCIIVAHWPDPHTLGILLSTGYSRELAGNTHAEANALAKARLMTSEVICRLFGVAEAPSIDELLRNADVYTTMEPCSIRTSGLPPCADALIHAKIRRCLIGVAEPSDFVICEGERKLRRAGIEVVWLKGMEQECLDEARRGHLRA